MISGQVIFQATLSIERWTYNFFSIQKHSGQQQRSLAAESSVRAEELRAISGQLQPVPWV